MSEPRPNHTLTPAENEQIFRTDIAPDYLPSGFPQAERPTLIVLGGQPGSGKTAVLTSSQRELAATGPAIRIVGDDLRAYHPSFAHLQSRDADTASQFTQADAGRWTEKLLAAALERRVHVVFETTMRTPENVARIMALGRETGYRVEARAVAVHPRVSWQGCHHRFEEMHHAGEAARMPPRPVHDAGAAGVIASLMKIEEEGLADRVQIRLRSGEIVYDNTREVGAWLQPAEAGPALERERHRVLSRETIQRFADDWSLVLSRMAERNAGPDCVAAVEIQAKEDVAHFLTQRRDADMTEGRTVRQDRLHPPRPREIDAPVTDVADNERRLSAEYQLQPTGERPRASGILIPAHELPDLTESDIGRRLGGSARLGEKRAEIERLAQFVYGESSTVASVTRHIGSVSEGAAAADDVRTGKLGPLAGDGGSWFRSDSSARQTAKAHAPQLAAVLADYGQTVDFERHEVLTRHREEQQRQRQLVKAPSSALAQALEARPDEQSRRLRESPELRRELYGMMLAIHRRLSPEERSALHTGDTRQVAKTLRVTVEQAAQLRLVQVRGIEAQRHMQNQIQDRPLIQAAQNLSLKR